MKKSFLEFLDAHQGPEYRDAVWKLFEELCRCFGARFVTHVEVLPTCLDTNHITYHENKVPQWKERYLEQNYIRHDPAVRMALCHQRPFFFERMGSLDPDRFSKIERQITSEAHDFGFGNGIIIPFFGYPGLTKGSITLFAERDMKDAWQSMVRYTNLLIRCALELHMWFSENPPSLPGRQRLTARETECVRLLSSGLYRPQIAERMGISVDRVNQLIRSAKKRLGATTSEELVARVVERKIRFGGR